MERFEHSAIDSLLKALQHRGYTVIAPTVRNGAIVYEEISSASELPVGWTDEQDSARYRLERREDQTMFSYSVGPHSWKKFLFPPVLKLFTAERTSSGFEMQADSGAPPQAGAAAGKTSRTKKLAFLGVRPCEVQAIAIQDGIFVDGPYADPYYKAMRESCFIIAVNCTEAGGTCFCASMNSGPKAAAGFDLALTEVSADGAPYFVVELGSAKGEEIMQDLPHRTAEPGEARAAEEAIQKAENSMGRTLETANLKELLFANAEHPRWDQIARRCLTCANCTQVCPTCFCSTVEDVTDLTGAKAERVRKWDSCFTTEFSYIHGGSIRATARSRYRQWIMHKLSNWIDQFGTFGCVGCGRCITWCPVGIDITEEARAIREQQPMSVTTS